MIEPDWQQEGRDLSGHMNARGIHLPCGQYMEVAHVREDLETSLIPGFLQQCLWLKAIMVFL